MPSYNRIVMMGHLTREPELRATVNGSFVATVGLASNRRYKQGDDLKEEVCFVDMIAFGKTAEIVGQYLSKGDCIHIEGRLQQRRWETDSGEKRQKHEIVADHVTFIKTKKTQHPEGMHDDAPPYT